VAGEASDVRLALDSLSTTKCDVLLLDSLTAVYATELINELKVPNSSRRVVLFGMDGDDETFFKAVRLGVKGYLLKDASSAEIIAAIHNVSAGKGVCPPSLCLTLFQCVAREFRERAGIRVSLSSQKNGLTFRQRELIGLIAKGLTNKEIAGILSLSEFTVKNRVYRIMRHVEAESRQEAVEAARAKGLLPKAYGS
jgi:DNA-binding NarL/FixJ family response regulator